MPKKVWRAKIVQMHFLPGEHYSCVTFSIALSEEWNGKSGEFDLFDRCDSDGHIL